MTTLPAVSTMVTVGDHASAGALVDARIIGSQQTFRVVLGAMATPGRIGQLIWEPALLEAIDARDRWLAALLLALADHEVSVAVELDGRSGAFADEIGRWTRAGSARPDTADMVVADAATIDSDLPRRLRRGSLEYPDDSALLMLLVERLADSGPVGLELTLEGPGVDGQITLSVEGLSAAVLASRARAVSQYPTGIDLLLVDRAGRIVGLPRTAIVTVGRDAGREG
jgi:alpha-D-ribose 1-methylphosphonate 5-triphosphate synthase subunit PhnH